jgi:hypothetical protein
MQAASQPTNKQQSKQPKTKEKFACNLKPYCISAKI